MPGDRCPICLCINTAKGEFFRLKKIKLIYIVSVSHSGSTLLDLTIGSTPEVFSMGEIGYYPGYRDGWLHKYPKCTCKKPFHECPFWAPINREKYNLYRYEDLEPLKRNMISHILFPSIMKKPEMPSDDESVSFLRHVYERASESNKDLVYLLDSSKSLTRLFYLSQQKALEIYPILLVRDGRGVLNSWSKWIKNKRSFMILLEWIATTYLARRFLKKNPRSLHISYDLFCKDPRRHIRNLNERLNITISEDAFLDRMAEKVYHNVDGNRLRFQRIAKIRCDEKWRKELSPLKKFVATVLLYPFNRMWVHRDSVTD